MDLTTTYMGLKLRTPLVPSASPLSDDISKIKKMEDAGAGAIVLYSLFEEQLLLESRDVETGLAAGTDSFAEASSFFPKPDEFRLGPEEYLKHIRKAKDAVQIPIIASLNGCSMGGWTDYARQMEQAGADAIELNLYNIPTDMNQTSEQLEKTYLEIIKAVKGAVKVPVAVKLSPYFTNLASFAKRVDLAGANALVLFNRFYQPDIDLEALEVKPNVLLSTPQALRLPLRWIAILHGRIKASLAATSGIHSGQDVIKVLMAGADCAQICSALLKNGIDHLWAMDRGMREWMEKHEYSSVAQMKGSMSQIKCSNPSAFERAQYMKALATYKV